MRSSCVISLFSALVVLLHAVAVESLSFPRQHPQVQIIPNVPSQHSVTAQWISSAHTLDNPKLSAVNETSGEWWYFDVASAGKANLVIVVLFHNQHHFPFARSDSEYQSGIESQGRLRTARSSERAFLRPMLLPQVWGDGTSGVWEGTGVSWAGTPDMSGYIVTINNPEYGVKGSLTLKSVSSVLQNHTGWLD